MSIHFRQTLILWLIIWSFSSLNGQVVSPINEDWKTNLSTTISQKGYQNITLQEKGKQLWIYYENRVQRFEPRAIIDIIKTIDAKTLPNTIESIHIITQKLQQPLLTTSFALNDYEYFKKGKISLEMFIDNVLISQGGEPLKRPQNKSITNTGNYRLELEIKPQIGLGLGGFPDPVVHRLFLLPTFNAYLWKGAVLQMEVVLPISSEFEIPEEHFIRPGIISFSQTLRLSKQLWLQGSVGYFSKNRYGGRLSAAKFLFNGALTLTGNIGYTGYAAYPIKLGLEEAIKGWEYADINYLDYSMAAKYWFKNWNTELNIEYGKVLFDKNQLKVAVLQRFNEVDIGFFALRTQRGNNYGMQLNIPIFPKKYWKPKRVSIRPSNSLQYTYHATQAFAEEYITGNAILDFHRQLNPEFLKKQLRIPTRWQFD